MKKQRLPHLRPYSLAELAELLEIRPLTLSHKLEAFKTEIGEPEDKSFNQPRYSIRQVKIIFEKLF
jgi:hypothetical protein